MTIEPVSGLPDPKYAAVTCDTIRGLDERLRYYAKEADRNVPPECIVSPQGYEFEEWADALRTALAQLEEARAERERWAEQAMKEDDCRKMWQARAEAAEARLEELTRERDDAKAHDNLITEKLQALGEKYGCPAGMRRLVWLEHQLARHCSPFRMEAPMRADLIERLKIGLDALRARASRGGITSAEVFSLTNPMMDLIARQPAADALASLSSPQEPVAWRDMSTAPAEKGARVLAVFPFGEDDDDMVGEVVYYPNWIERGQTSPWLWAEKDDTFIVRPHSWIPLPSVASPVLPVAAKAEAPTHRHLKSGHLVRVLGIGKMQSSMWTEPVNIVNDAGSHTAHILVDMREVVIYEHGGGLWARPREEFEDGRFEALPAAPTCEGEGQP